MTKPNSRRAKARRARFEADIKSALAHQPTRRLLGTIFDLTGIYAPAPIGSGPEAIAAHAGARKVGLDLRGMIDAVDPLAFVAIEAEAISQREALKVEAAAEQREDEDSDAA